MAFLRRQSGPAIAIRSLLLLLLPAAAMSAQNPRLRGVAAQQPPPPAAVSAGQAVAPSPTAAQSPSAPQVAPSMLQQPAREAQIVFAGDTLSIHADNSSLAGILHQFAAKSGMRIEGLASDERVFGSFGPGTPRDVLADLLNGTSYNLVLLGDLNNGAPRQLILTPSTHGPAAVAASPSPQVNPDEASTDQEAQEVYIPEVPTPLPSSEPPPPAPGVRTPQQLFEQLQRMRQGQDQQQTVTTPEDQPQEQAPQ